MRKQVLLLTCGLVSLWHTHGWAQCAILPTATAGTQAFVVAGTAPNPMGFVYNPNRNLYYCIFGGSASYSMEVFTPTGTRLTTVSPVGLDYRGLWWNPALSQLEGNAYNNVSVAAKPLDANGYPVATTVNVIFSPGNSLTPQNLGAYDPLNNEIVYYSAGTIKRVNRVTNATLATTAVTGLPVVTTAINDNIVLYTGCAGREYALYNTTAKAVYFVSRATMAYVGTSLLPATAPSGNGSFGVQYTNNQLYLFNYTTRTWNSYAVLSGTLATAPPTPDTRKLVLLPNPAREQVRVQGATGAVRLLDLTGRVLREQPATEALSLSGLAAGIYLVRNGTRTARLQVE